MVAFDTFNLKKSWPLLVALLLVAQVDLASSFGWPQSLLSLLHLTAATNDLCSGVCAGLGTSIDVLVIYQLARIWAKPAFEASRDTRHD